MGFYKGTGAKKANDEVKYEVVEKCGVISTRGNYTLELRLVKWNDNEAKYDIRPWKDTEDGTEKMLKGITLSGDEIESLYGILKGIAEQDKTPQVKGARRSRKEA